MGKNRRIFSHYAMGLGGMDLLAPRVEETFKALFQRLRQRLNPSNIMSWDFKTKQWEDLCAFLNIKDCPEKGRLKTEPNGYTDLLRNGGRGWDFNCDEPVILIPLYLVLHWVNFKIFRTIILTLPCGLLRRGIREKAD